MFFPRARRVKTVNLGAVFARAAYKRPSATLVGNCQLGSLTTGSPAGHLRERGFKGEHGLCWSVPPLLWTKFRGLQREGGVIAAIATAWWLNVQSGLQDPGNNTPDLLQFV